MGAFDELFARYVPRLRAQLHELQTLLSAERIEEALALAHKIAGASGSYGLRALGEEARALERSLESASAGSGELARVTAMLASLPPVASAPRSARILVLGEASGSDLLATSDPREAFEWAMDQPLSAVVVPYPGGRSLLRRLATLDGFREVPIVLTGVDAESAQLARQKTGARLTFATDLNDEVLERVRELTR